MLRLSSCVTIIRTMISSAPNSIRKHGRRQALLGAEAAHFFRAGRARRPEDIRHGRSHILGRQRDRKTDPGRSRKGPDRAHQLRDRTPAVHHPQRRPHSVHRGRTHRRAGIARRAPAHPRPLLPPLHQPIPTAGGGGSGVDPDAKVEPGECRCSRGAECGEMATEGTYSLTPISRSEWGRQPGR